LPLVKKNLSLQVKYGLLYVLNSSVNSANNNNNNTNAERDRLESIVQICFELLDLLDRIDPGRSRNRGWVLKQARGGAKERRRQICGIKSFLDKLCHNQTCSMCVYCCKDMFYSRAFDANQKYDDPDSAASRKYQFCFADDCTVDQIVLRSAVGKPHHPGGVLDAEGQGSALCKGTGEAWAYQVFGFVRIGRIIIDLVVFVTSETQSGRKGSHLNFVASLKVACFTCFDGRTSAKAAAAAALKKTKKS
jgi:hypothetical protein